MKLLKASADFYRKWFVAFLNKNQAKRDSLFRFLVKYPKNGDNKLITQDSLSYAHVKQRLLDIDTYIQDANLALLVFKPLANNKNG